MSVIDGNGKENFLLSYLFPKELDTVEQIDLHNQIRDKISNVMYKDYPEIKFTLGDSSYINPKLTDDICEWTKTDEEGYQNCRYSYEEIPSEYVDDFIKGFRFCPYCRKILKIKQEEQYATTKENI